MDSESAEAKFTVLYEQHYDEVLAYCTRRVGRTDADDAAADVFAVAWRRIHAIEWDTVRPWLYGIARGVLANRFRSGRRQRTLLGRVKGLARVADEAAEVQVVRRADDQEVVDAVAGMRAADREVLLLAAWEGLTGPEVAASLGISVSAAEQRLHRAKRRLAGRLEESGRSNLSPRAAEEGGGR